jgi:hypothetical protein
MFIALLYPKITGITENTPVFIVRQTAGGLALPVLVFYLREARPHSSTESYAIDNDRMIAQSESY